MLAATTINMAIPTPKPMATRELVLPSCLGVSEGTAIVGPGSAASCLVVVEVADGSMLPCSRVMLVDPCVAEEFAGFGLGSSTCAGKGAMAYVVKLSVARSQHTESEASERDGTIPVKTKEPLERLQVASFLVGDCSPQYHCKVPSLLSPQRKTATVVDLFSSPTQKRGQDGLAQVESVQVPR